MAPRLALLRIALLLIAAFGAAPPAGAQNPFETVARVNDSVVTRFEVGQRERLMQVLRVPGTNADAALQALIDDRLKMEAARSAELIPTEDQVQSGLDDRTGGEIRREELELDVARRSKDRDEVRTDLHLAFRSGDRVLSPDALTEARVGPAHVAFYRHQPAAPGT